VALEFLSKRLGLTVDLSSLESAVEATQNLLGRKPHEDTKENKDEV
jgi:diacylglycerol kinase